MKNENYFVIHGWMINKLKLKGKELLIYAIIYGFSQAPGTKYTGSQRYLSECSGIPKRTLSRILNSLCDKGLLIKEPKEINNITLNDYTAIIPEINSDDVKETEMIVADDLEDMLNKVNQI